MSLTIKDVNLPKHRSNKFYADYDNTFDFDGFIDYSIRFIQDFSLTDNELWSRFAEQFKSRSDSPDLAWRGEYWGKMMRGACFTYSYTKSEKLYDALTKTVKDIMTAAEKNGRISTYNQDAEFRGWDMWCRKYVLLGMQYYIEICDDEKLISEIVTCMCKQLDYIIGKIGAEADGKMPITSTSSFWRGANSVSILEPVVRLYNMTKNQSYLKFAEYIVSTGGTDVENLFELAYENKLYPYQYPITKAYEVTSCFEGLLEYCAATGNERYKTAVINFADKILESDFTIIGGSGCTHELFDHSTVRQANTNNDIIMQETCVTVTLMKFFYRLNMLTGNSKYADAFEVSMYNAFLGSINTGKAVNPSVTEKHPNAVVEPLPFDSYSPLTAGARGVGIGGLCVMPDNHYYGCCACIGSLGTGLIPKMAVLSSESAVIINLYINGTVKTVTPGGKELLITVKTDYPKGGKVQISLNTNDEESFDVLFRNPSWSKKTALSVSGNERGAADGYIVINQAWNTANEIILDFDMRTRAVRPTPYGHQVLMNKVVWEHNYVVPFYDEEDVKARRHTALLRGPIVLAVDNRLGYDVDLPMSIDADADGYVKAEIANSEDMPYENIVALKIPMKDGGSFAVTDYASAGKLWTNESKMAAWILTDNI